MNKQQLNDVLDALYEFLEIEPEDVAGLFEYDNNQKRMKKWLSICEELPDKIYAPADVSPIIGRLMFAHVVLSSDSTGKSQILFEDLITDMKRLCMYCSRLELGIANEAE